MIRPLTIAACLLAACSRRAPAGPPDALERDASSATTPQHPSWSRDPPPSSAPALTPLRDVPLALDPGPAPEALNLHTVVEGPCPWLDVSLLDREAFLHWKFGADLARLLPDGRIEPLQLPITITGRRADEFRIDHVGGSWPDDLWVHFEDDITRLSRLNRVKPSYAWRQHGVWSAVMDPRFAPGRILPLHVHRLAPWLGGVLGLSYGTPPRFVSVRGEGQAPNFPELRRGDGECIYTESSLKTFASGELVLVGDFCRERQRVDAWDLVAARWSADRGVVDILPHPPGEWSRTHRLAAPAPDRYHVSADFSAGPHRAQYTMLTSFDGATWSEPAVFVGRSTALAADHDGAPWLVIDGEVHRRATDGSWERLVMTSPGERPLHVHELGGLEGELAWLRTTGGALWLRPAGGAFVLASVPAPTLEADRRFTIDAPRISGRDVWVPARYWSGPNGHQHEIRALLRNGPVHSTLRCTASGQLAP